MSTTGSYANHEAILKQISERNRREIGHFYSLNRSKSSQKPGSNRRLKSAGSIGIDSISPLGVDADAMSVTAIISTPARDRVNDILIPSGCILKHYVKNPVVYWEHGFDLTLPIAMSEEPQTGRLTVGISDNDITATAYFTNKVREAEQIFELIHDRFIRATSVRANPVKTNYQRDGEDTVFVMEEWELEEWSFVGIGCNPEALQGVVSKGRLAGGPIAEPILKSLKAWLPERKTVGRGISFEQVDDDSDSDNNDEGKNDGQNSNNEGKNVTVKNRKTETANTSGGGSATGKSPQKPGKNKNSSTTGRNPRFKMDDDYDPEESDAEGLDDSGEMEMDGDSSEHKGVNGDNGSAMASSGQMKYGQTLLAAQYSALSEIVANTEKAMEPLENTTVRDGLSAILEEEKEKLSAIEGLYSTAYPDAEPLKFEAPSEDEEEAALKSFLAGSAGSRFAMIGLASALKHLSRAKNLRPDQRSGLHVVVKRLEAIARKAEKSAKEKGSRGREEALQGQGISEQAKAELEALKKSVAEAQKRLQQSIPHRQS